MAFLDDYKRFYGTGERNRAGQTLDEFLEDYNPKLYDCPSNTTDIIVVKCKEKLTRWGQPLQVLLVKRANHPGIGFWATPGGFVDLKENLMEGAARELEEETGVKSLPLQQLYTWGDYDRDPRWRVITTSFLALVEGDIPVKAGDDAADALWMDVSLSLEETNTGSNAETWKLDLKNEAHQVQAGARIRIARSSHLLLSQERYELVESQGLAADHGCLITQALLYLRERLNGLMFNQEEVS